MSAVKCPSCGSTDFVYVMASIESHSMDSMPDDTGHVELLAMESSYTLESFCPYLECESCEKTFDMHCVEISSVLRSRSSAGDEIK